MSEKKQLSRFCDITARYDLTEAVKIMSHTPYIRPMQVYTCDKNLPCYIFDPAVKNLTIKPLKYHRTM